MSRKIINCFFVLFVSVICQNHPSFIIPAFQSCRQLRHKQSGIFLPIIPLPAFIRTESAQTVILLPERKARLKLSSCTFFMYASSGTFLIYILSLRRFSILSGIQNSQDNFASLWNKDTVPRFSARFLLFSAQSLQSGRPGPDRPCAPG